MFPSKAMTTDNGREFNNREVSEWASEKGMHHNFSIPHYHQSNKRIERANRTIRNALKKPHGPTKIKLKSIIDNYNELNHRALGMSPKEALEEKIILTIKEKEKLHKNEFKTKNLKSKNFHEGERVLISNEVKLNKMDDEYSEQGKGLKRESDNVQ